MYEICPYAFKMRGVGDQLIWGGLSNLWALSTVTSMCIRRSLHKATLYQNSYLLVELHLYNNTINTVLDVHRLQLYPYTCGITHELRYGHLQNTFQAIHSINILRAKFDVAYHDLDDTSAYDFRWLNNCWCLILSMLPSDKPQHQLHPYSRRQSAAPQLACWSTDTLEHERLWKHIRT